MGKLARLAALSTLAVATAAIGLATPAHAAEPVKFLAVSPWLTLDTSDGTSNPFPGTWTTTAPQVPSTLSTIENGNTVRLKWGTSNLGTSVETNNLGLTVAAGAQVSFKYQLLNGATCTTGAPRMFVYIGNASSTPGNRPAAAPTAQSNHCDGAGDAASSGVVTFTIPSAGKIGYAGITYDNGVAGEVLITDVTIGDTLVWFVPNPPNVTVDVDGCKATLTFDNSGPYRDSNNKAGPWDMAFDYKLPGDPQQPVEPSLDGLTISDPPLKGQPFDGLFNKVPVKAGTTETVTVDLEPTDDKIEYRLVRGAEQRMFFDWQAVKIDPDECKAPPAAAPELPKTGASGVGTLTLLGVSGVLLGALLVMAGVMIRRRRA